MPTLPTLSEAGLPSCDAAPWIGVVAPGGTTQPVVVTLNRHLNLVLQVQKVREAQPDHDIEPAGGLPEHFARHIRSESAKWQRVAREPDLSFR